MDPRNNAEKQAPGQSPDHIPTHLTLIPLKINEETAMKIFIPHWGANRCLKNYSLQDSEIFYLPSTEQPLCPHWALVQMVKWTAGLITRKISAASHSSKAILACFPGFRVWDEANNLQSASDLLPYQSQPEYLLSEIHSASAIYNYRTLYCPELGDPSKYFK